ncbi:hypothetical protein PV326_011560, partial [Microctonus aethiopoides]
MHPRCLAVTKTEKCKTKWKNLRDGFQRALKSAKTKSGQAAKSTRKWRFYDAMSFLLPYLKVRETHLNIDEVHVEHDEIDRTTELSELEQGNESVNEEMDFPFQTQPGTPLSTLSTVCSSEKTETSTVHRKRKNPKKQEEAETMPELFREFLDEKKETITIPQIQPLRQDSHILSTPLSIQ